MHLSQLDILQKLLKHPLPGWDAQRKLTPVNSSQYRLKKAGSKQAAVMALLYPNDQNLLEIVYIKRPSHNPHDLHGGQVSFPGGQLEQSDLHFKDTALRETMEEIGVEKEHVQIIGALSPLYVFVSNFYVQPYVGYIPKKPTFILQESEVDYVITETLDTLVNPNTIKEKDLLIRGNTIPKVPFFDIQGETLWGATAMITSELLEVIKKI